jgi:hypothetical protein
MQRGCRCLVIKGHLNGCGAICESCIWWQLFVTLEDWVWDCKIFIVSSCIFFHLGLKLLYFSFKLANWGPVQLGWLTSIILLVKVL